MKVTLKIFYLITYLCAVHYSTQAISKYLELLRNPEKKFLFKV